MADALCRSGRASSENPFEAKVQCDYVREILHSGGFVIEADRDEIEELKAGMYAQRSKARQISLTIAPTMDCNLACSYCYAARNPKGRMSPAIQKAVVQFAESNMIAAQAKSLFVTWIGGEPTMAFDIISDMSGEVQRLCAAHEMEYSASVVTNGTLVTAEMAKAMRDVCRVRTAQLTIDGYDHDVRRPWRSKPAEHKQSCMQCVIDAYHLLGAYLERVAVRINVDCKNGNVAELVRFAKYLEGHGISPDVIYLGYVHGIIGESRAYADYSLTRQEFAKRELQWLKARNIIPTVLGPRLTPCTHVEPYCYTIDPEGYVSRCWDYIGYPDKRVGHVTTGLFKNDPCKDFMSYAPFERKDCRECVWIPTCMGGCPALAVTGAASGRATCHTAKFLADEWLRSVGEGLSSKQPETPAICTV
jgi:uncharacterized protein